MKADYQKQNFARNKVETKTTHIFIFSRAKKWQKRIFEFRSNLSEDSKIRPFLYNNMFFQKVSRSFQTLLEKSQQGDGRDPREKKSCWLGGKQKLKQSKYMFIYLSTIKNVSVFWEAIQNDLSVYVCVCPTNGT